MVLYTDINALVRCLSLSFMSYLVLFAYFASSSNIWKVVVSASVLSSVITIKWLVCILPFFFLFFLLRFMSLEEN